MVILRRGIVEKNDIFSHLNPYKQRLESGLIESIQSIGCKSELRDACEYALLNGGKRFRPAIVLVIAEALKSPVSVLQAALAVEYFHTASLIADDLPCMDDDDKRRGKPSLHKVYGESTALLASYALIAAGYECLAKNTNELRAAAVSFAKDCDRICVLSLENATYNTGLMGASGGQFLDISPPDLSEKTLRGIIHKKTVSLFEISFVLGWLFGGGKKELLGEVKQAASHFGMAFQLADDFDDMAQDIKNDRKVNMANACGKKEALGMFHKEIEEFQKKLKLLNLDRSPLHHISEALLKQVDIAV